MTSYDISQDFGTLYDTVPAYAQRTADVAFYVSEAARAGQNGRVLELGCGTGRVLLPIARAGYTITGVDSSRSMLDRLESKLAEEPREITTRVRLHEADVRDFNVGEGGFSLAIAPFRVFQHMVTIDDQLRCLNAVHRHLAPGGRFAFDVFNPHFALMTADRSAEAEDTPPFELPDGRTFWRNFRITAVHWVKQVNDVELIYYLRKGDKGDVERVVHKFGMRWYTASELENLLTRAGFRVEAMYGTFERGELTDSAPEIVVVASVP